MFGYCVFALYGRANYFSAVVDCFVQEESLVLTAARWGHQQVVKTLIKATTGINGPDAKVCHIASIAVVSSVVNSCLSLLVTD